MTVAVCVVSVSWANAPMDINAEPAMSRILGSLIFILIKI